jgi:6-phosphogluconolactonase
LGTEIGGFDLIFLGMGDDGHTASLFPGTAAVHESERWVVANYVQKLGSWRITLTPVAINSAQLIVFLVAGVSKAVCLKELRQGVHNPTLYPAQVVHPQNGQVVWMVDEQAASLLK